MFIVIVTTNMATIVYYALAVATIVFFITTVTNAKTKNVAINKFASGTTIIGTISAITLMRCYVFFSS